MSLLHRLSNRFKNLWAWSAYHPSDNQPENVGFTFTGFKKKFNVAGSEKVKILTKEPNLQDLIGKIDE